MLRDIGSRDERRFQMKRSFLDPFIEFIII